MAAMRMKERPKIPKAPTSAHREPKRSTRGPVSSAATLPKRPPSMMGVVKAARDQPNSAETGLRKMPRTGRASVLALNPPSATMTTMTQP